MDDARTIHASSKDCDVVRYNRAGKWYLEPHRADKPRQQVSIADAARYAVWAVEHAEGQIHFHRPGGNAFDRVVARISREELPDPERRIRVQRGELPARNVTELVDALRQDMAGAGANLSSIRLLLERGETDQLERPLEQLTAHLKRMSSKATLAIDAAAPNVRSDLDL